MIHSLIDYYWLFHIRHQCDSKFRIAHHLEWNSISNNPLPVSAVLDVFFLCVIFSPICGVVFHLRDNCGNPSVGPISFTYSDVDVWEELKQKVVSML
jgi:hypothetical protein